MSDEHSVVFETHDEAEAEMVVDLLEREGLDPRMRGTRNAALLGAASFAFRLEVEVRAEQAARAEELLQALLADHGAAPEISEEEWRLPPAQAGEEAVPSEDAGKAAREEAGSDEDPEPPAQPLRTSNSPVLAPLLGLIGVLLALYAATGPSEIRISDLGALRGFPPPGELYRLVTASFLHFDLAHLLSNLEGLVIYGWAAISLFGLARAAFAYMAAALAGGLACSLFAEGHGLASGASGCVFALVAMVLAGRLRQARVERVARWRGWARVIGWALFVIPAAFFFNYAVHVAGLVVGAVLGFGMAIAPSNEDDPRLSRRGRLWAALAVALFLLPWGQRLAASLYAPCATGGVDRCWQACEGGSLSSCHALGTRLMAEREPDAGRPDPARALAALERACAGGVAEACTNYGMLLWGEGEEPAARAALVKACDGTSSRGCTELGRREPDPDQRLVLFGRGCDQGDAHGCLLLGLAHQARSGDDALGIAAAALQRGCDRGEPRACTALAGMRAVGRGVPSNADLARDLYQRGCRGGDDEACRELDPRRTGHEWRTPFAPRDPGPRLPVPFLFI